MSKTNVWNPLLLDTHVWLWLINGSAELSPRTVKFIEEHSRKSHLRISIISIWEIGMLSAKGRIELPGSVTEWTHKALGVSNISLAPLNPEIAILSTQLPGNFHGDPADRILFATAKILGASLVTRDRALLDYAKKQNLPVIAA